MRNLFMVALAILMPAAAPGLAAEGAAALQVRDLTPLTAHPAPSHVAVQIVKAGKPVAKVYVADAKPGRNLKLLVEELQTAVKLSTGAQLEVVAELPSADTPAIVIGDCEQSRKAGIDAGKLPIEGFVVKTAPKRVYLVGSTVALPSNRNTTDSYPNDGTAWAVTDFLERFVGVRWYWPAQAGGRSVVKAADLAVPPAHYSDAPVFRKRSHHPWYYGPPWRSRGFDKEHPEPPAAVKGLERLDMQPLLACLRSGNSWPYQIKVHQPQSFPSSDAWLKEHAAMFEVKEDGTRTQMLCYSSQAAFDFLLKGCQDTWDDGKWGSPWVTELYLSISPADGPVNCYCPECRKLFDPQSPKHGRASGEASKIMGTFVKKVCEEVKRRWPDKKVIYLPYYNYTICPEDIDFPDNLEIEMCTTGFAEFRQPSVRAGIEKNLRAWRKKAGGKITSWEYSCWVTHLTHAPIQFPHLLQDYYRANRDVLAGSFINGMDFPEWSKAAPSLYCWLRVLWNPDVNVDAILDEMCQRMFGKAAGTSRELIRLMCDRWEKAPWSEPLGSRIHPVTFTKTLHSALTFYDRWPAPSMGSRIQPVIFTDTWPPEVVAEMKKLRQQAREGMKDDPDALARFDYWNWTFEAFLKEAGEVQAEAKP